MKAFRKILPLLLALALIISMAPTTFAADEITEDKTYILKRVETNGDEMGPNLLFTSLYMFHYAYDGNPHSYQQTNIYNMYDTITLETIPVYCSDITTEATGGIEYRRLNLEDSTFSGDAAGKIRAILTYGFYVEELPANTHSARATAEAAALGRAAGIEGRDLTVSEAVAATQFAIWQAVHGSRLDFTDLVITSLNASYNETWYMPKENCKYYELCQAELWPERDGYGRIVGQKIIDFSGTGNPRLSTVAQAEIKNRIQTVYNYLLKLDPMPADPRIASASSFVDLNDPTFTNNGDGTYTVTITTTVDVQMQAGDDLTVKAELGDSAAYKDIRNGQQDLTFTLSNVPADQINSPIYLSIYGKQSGTGYFLFDPGQRDTAQTMVGMTTGSLPVYARVRVEESRSLSIHKTTESGRPLEGIIFDIYPVADLEEYLNGTANLPEPEEYKYPAKADYVLITDAEGNASLDLTQHNLKDGVYLVVEKPHPAIVAPVAPFYVIVPQTTEDGTGYDYSVTLQPKNQVKGNITIDKDVLKLGNDEATVDASASHQWIITTSIPDDIDLGKSYVITDTLDNRLDYRNNLKVAVETVAGDSVKELVKDVDYTFTLTDVDSEGDGKPSDAFSLALTPDGMGAIAAAVGTKAGDHRLRVYFDAQINSNAAMGENIPNQASVEYLNSVNFAFNAESDEPFVYTGGINLLKVDANNTAKTLSGATFEVYRPATTEELAGTTVKLPGYAAPMIQVSFYNNPAMSGDPVTSVTSGADGKIAIYGLKHGTYYLVETQAPAGYNLMGAPLELTIDASSHLDANVQQIKNVTGTVLPDTGGMGTTAFTLGGTALMAISILLILSKKRRAAN